MIAPVAAALLAVPLVMALLLAAGDGLAPSAWTALCGDAQTPRAIAASLWIGLASTSISLALSLWITTRYHGSRIWARLERSLGVALSVPHVAFSVGLALLAAPSGALARLLAPLFEWHHPPAIDTLHEPLGLALIATLVLKETPFLLWAMASQLSRSGQAAELVRQAQVAASLGYPRRSAWWRIVWPQLLPRLAWPLLAVWAYSLTVVDVALVLGPNHPPTLAVLAWQWLLDADPARNAQGSAAAWCLAALVAAGAFAAALVWRGARPAWIGWAAGGERPANARGGRSAAWVIAAVALVYAAVIAMLGFASVATVWTFPALLPQQASTAAWSAVGDARATLALTAALGLAAAAGGLAMAVAWLEFTPPSWDRRAAWLIFAPLVLPGVLLAAGLYQLALRIGADASALGLWIGHLVFTAPYALVALAPAYRGFDARLAQSAAGLGRGRMAFLWRIKWPMLAGPLAAALAVGFAVSVAQFLPTQFIGAGRYATLTTEAVTLASGGQRDLASAFALMQALWPAIGFGLAAAWMAHRRRRDA